MILLERNMISRVAVSGSHNDIPLDLLAEIVNRLDNLRGSLDGERAIRLTEIVLEIDDDQGYLITSLWGKWLLNDHRRVVYRGVGIRLSFAVSSSDGNLPIFEFLQFCTGFGMFSQETGLNEG
jgi:hypothetical protein